MSFSRRGTLVHPTVLVAALIAIGGACSSTTDRASSTTVVQGTPTGTLPPLVAPPRSAELVLSEEAASVEEAFRALQDAFERQDVGAAISLYSDPGPSLGDDLAAFMRDYRVPLYRINSIEVEGTTATIAYENAIVGRNLDTNVTTLLSQRDVWASDDGTWKRVSGESSAPGIPEDLETVTATLADGEPIELPDELPDTDFAFLLKNTGSVTKGVFIVGVPAGFDVPGLVAVLESSDDAELPDEVSDMGSTPDVPPRMEGTMVFNVRLPTGRYVLLSRSAEGNGDPALLPNEYAEFAIR